MKEYLIGTGGWAYFQVPKLNPLVAYSRAFNFVEVNSTFYQMPSPDEVRRWRKLVPSDFQFAVRANRRMLQARNLQSSPDTLAAFDKMKQICSLLKADVLHLQIPASLNVTQTWIGQFRDFVSSADLGKLRLAVEIRGVQPSKLPAELLKLMQGRNMIHCVDVSKGEMPAYASDILYSRLFGKGQHNVYQPTDEELAEMDSKVSNSGSQKIVMSFHFVRMYKDAARLKIYTQTGRFPKVTGSTGRSSLEEVLSEDVELPSTKQELMRSQGWKLFDLNGEKRVHASDFLQKLPEKTYVSIGEIMENLKPTFK
ncbi:MAG: DUF72 domain-containing protein [Candidatus Bathyarchaeia archaeon]